MNAIEAGGAEAVIPPKKNRVIKREYDKIRYKELNVVERFLNRIKQCRRIATCYEKTDQNLRECLHLAAIMRLLC